MRSAEIASGVPLSDLMEQAGRGVADAVLRLGNRAPTLVLCGPGNNGGDGYVAALLLAEAGVEVRVAALTEPETDLAKAARTRWPGPVDTIADAHQAPIVVDALFGTGANRALDPATFEQIRGLIGPAQLSIAVDMPSGQDSDTGGDLRDTHALEVDITLALGALKPCHLLYPSAERCGEVRLIELGLRNPPSRDRTMDRPWAAPPGHSSHKYSRGMVVVIGGAMPGAAALAAEAAMHAGAGYGLLLSDAPSQGAPHALVRKQWSQVVLQQAVAGKGEGPAIVIGPGLGRDEAARAKLDAAIETGLRLVIDGDALHLLTDADFDRFKARPLHMPVVLTPHQGEFKALFGEPEGNKLDAARDAARRSRAIVVYKGPDTVVAHPNGQTRVGPHASAWLSTAGTGDVLAGPIGAMLTANITGAVEAGVWMHNAAAWRLGAAFLADDLARELAAVRGQL